MVKEKKEKNLYQKIWSWTTNILLISIIIILFVPSWRLAFSSTMQKLFMGSTKIEKTMKTPLNFSQEDWILFDAKTQMHSFSEFKGKPIVLNFWATWCPGCRAELPQIMELKSQFQDDVHFISVTNETYDIIEKSGEYDKHSSFIYFASNFSSQFDFSVYPTTFIIDSDFNIVQKIEGATKLDSPENIAFLKNL